MVSSAIVRGSQTGCAPTAFRTFTRGLLQAIRSPTSTPTSVKVLERTRQPRFLPEEKRKKLSYALISARLIYVRDSLRYVLSRRKSYHSKKFGEWSETKGCGRKKKEAKLLHRRPCFGRFSREKTGRRHRRDKLCGANDNRRGVSVFD